MITDAEQLKARVSILDEIGRRVELHQRGCNWWGLCPFHQEQTPSFHVVPERDFWKCFGCGRGGDVFDFIMAYEQVDFPRALELLGGQRDLPPVIDRPAPAAKQDGGRRDDWRTYLAGLRSLYPKDAEGKLLIDQSTPGAAYLEGRGISYLFSVNCGVRYHPSWRGYGAAVVFPLRDQAGRLVAAEGRLINEPYPVLNGKPCKTLSAGPKSLGTFATFGAFEQSDIIIVEGPINALTLAQAGFPTVATCGAGNLARWLPVACAGKRRILLEFDNDEGGQSGMRRLYDPKTGRGLLASTDAEIIHLPILEPGSDWNDLLMQYGYDALQEALRRELKGE